MAGLFDSFIDGGLFLQFDDVVNKSPGYGQLIY